MNVSLTPELEKLVDQKVSSGLYQTASEVVREGLRLLKKRDDDLEHLRRDVREGFEAIDRGEYTDYDVTTLHRLTEGVKARGRRRLTEEKAKLAKR
jgi:antitoxin ParD1/3/4